MSWIKPHVVKYTKDKEMITYITYYNSRFRTNGRTMEDLHVS